MFRLSNQSLTESSRGARPSFLLFFLSFGTILLILVGRSVESVAFLLIVKFVVLILQLHKVAWQEVKVFGVVHVAKVENNSDKVTLS